MNQIEESRKYINALNVIMNESLENSINHVLSKRKQEMRKSNISFAIKFLIFSTIATLMYYFDDTKHATFFYTLIVITLILAICGQYLMNKE